MAKKKWKNLKLILKMNSTKTSVNVYEKDEFNKNFIPGVGFSQGTALTRADINNHVYHTSYYNLFNNNKILMYKRTFFRSFNRLKLLLTAFVLILFCGKIHSQIKFKSSTKNGIYYSIKNYEGYIDTTYFQLAFLNDSTFAMSSPWASANKGDLLSRFKTPSIYNNCFINNICIGRKILYEGKPQWIGIIDKDYLFNGGRKNYLQDFIDTTNRFNIKSATAFDWNAKNIDSVQIKNEYGIYKFNFHNNSFNISQIKFIERDDGILGQHNKLSVLPEYSKFFKDGVGWNIQNIEANVFNMSASINQKCSSLFLPLNDNIEGNHAFDFAENELVYIGYTYMKYAFVISFDKDTNKIAKYGWILRNYLKGVRKNELKIPNQ